MILGGDGIIWGEGILCGDLIRTWDWPAVLGGSWYLWAGALEVTRVAGLLRGGGRGCHWGIRDLNSLGQDHFLLSGLTPSVPVMNRVHYRTHTLMTNTM